MTDDDKTYTKLKTELKRGTGTRDQDKTVVTTRHPDPTMAAENHRKAVQHMIDLTDFARSVDPDPDADTPVVTPAETPVGSDDEQALSEPDADTDDELGAFDPSNGGDNA